MHFELFYYVSQNHLVIKIIHHLVKNETDIDQLLLCLNQHILTDKQRWIDSRISVKQNLWNSHSLVGLDTRRLGQF